MLFTSGAKVVFTLVLCNPQKALFFSEGGRGSAYQLRNSRPETPKLVQAGKLQRAVKPKRGGGGGGQGLRSFQSRAASLMAFARDCPLF